MQSSTSMQMAQATQSVLSQVGCTPCTQALPPGGDLQQGSVKTYFGALYWAVQYEPDAGQLAEWVPICCWPCVSHASQQGLSRFLQCSMRLCTNAVAQGCARRGTEHIDGHCSLLPASPHPTQTQTKVCQVELSLVKTLQQPLIHSAANVFRAAALDPVSPGHQLFM